MNYLPGTASLVEEIDSMFFVICITCNMFLCACQLFERTKWYAKIVLAQENDQLVPNNRISVQSICHSFLSSQLHGVHKIRDINMLFMFLIKYLISGGGTDTLVEIVNVI